MAYITLLLMVAVPLQSLAFLMGGITGEEMILSVIVLLVTAICYATVGIYFSTVTKKTLNASVLTYGFALLVTVALPLVTLVLAGFASAAAFSDQPRAEMILQYLFYALSATNPVTAGVVTEITLQQHGSIWVFTQTLSDGTPYPVLSPWIPFIVVYLGATIALITASVRQIRQIEE
jgi:hypothetical protein